MFPGVWHAKTQTQVLLTPVTFRLSKLSIGMHCAVEMPIVYKSREHDHLAVQQCLLYTEAHVHIKKDLKCTSFCLIRWGAGWSASQSLAARDANFPGELTVKIIACTKKTSSQAPSYASPKLWPTDSLTGEKCRATNEVRNEFKSMT